jgi:hypothetical protein
MIHASTHLSRRPSRRACQSGSTILAALGVLTVTLVLVSAALFEARNRFRTSHHSSRWSQAEHAAEAGVEASLMSAQKNSWAADGWSSAPGVPGDAAISQTFTLSNGVPATGPISASVSVDTITSLSSSGASGGLGAGSGAPPDPWVRINSTGRADVFGGAVAGEDSQDILLRKLSLRTDRKTGGSVTSPHASRTVEILAQPLARRPFKYAFVSKVLPYVRTHAKTDSYDSRDPSKSDFSGHGTYGTYIVNKKQANGDIATMDDSGAPWNLNGANIDGDVFIPNGQATNAGNITGVVSKDFQFHIPEEAAPTWTTVTQNHGVVVNTSKVLLGGTSASPTRHKFTSITLNGIAQKIRLQNPVGQKESWIEVWVTGDINIDSAKLSGIEMDPGVHATIHFGGNVNIDGGSGVAAALNNGNQLASTLLLRGYGGSSTDIKTFNMVNNDLFAVMSAPWYKITFDDASMNIHGSYIGYQLDVTTLTKMHYDEALDQYEYGPSDGYKVRSWVEAVR